MCPFKDVHNILCKYALRLGTSMYLCANGLGGLEVFGAGEGVNVSVFCVINLTAF